MIQIVMLQVLFYCNVMKDNGYIYGALGNHLRYIQIKNPLAWVMLWVSSMDIFYIKPLNLKFERELSGVVQLGRYLSK